MAADRRPTGYEFSYPCHDYLLRLPDGAPGTDELFVGNVVQRAIEKGLRVEAVRVSNDPYLDIGTPRDLLKALRRFSDLNDL